MNKRQIIVTEGEGPELVGDWKAGEVLQVAQLLTTWIENLPVTTPPKKNGVQSQPANGVPVDMES